jgi:two-component system alkaline phosphatase synthesis response regulator PhoP
MNLTFGTIALVEDEELIRSMIEINLESEGFTVESFERGEALLNHQNLHMFSAFILDLMLPGISGKEVTYELRQRDIHRPVMMVTAKGDLDECIRNLNNGADDYLVKPFDMKELIARVHVLLRRNF